MNLLKWYRPTTTEWTSFGRLTELQSEIERLFDAPLTELTRSSRLLSGWTPALDVYENQDRYIVKAELPGLKKEAIEASLQNDTLTISGERKNESAPKDAATHRSERFFGRFQRTVTLPVPVAADQVVASYQDGILTVTLPKTEAAKPKRIDVAAN